MNEQSTGLERVDQRTGVVETEASRAAREVEAAMIVAKRFPRDEVVCEEKIQLACQRKSLAAQAMYLYARGGTNIEGPSIRLAEAVAQKWGNLEAGIKELSRGEESSEIMAYAWDLESGNREVKVFHVSHWRHTKKGDYLMTDPRDIYEAAANQGQRRKRACLMAVIPGDVFERAIETCKKSLAEGHTEPLADRIRKMLVAFKNNFGVTKEEIEKRVQHRIESLNEQEMIQLGMVYRSLKDQVGVKADFFEEEQDIEMPKSQAEADTEAPQEAPDPFADDPPEPEQAEPT